MSYAQGAFLYLMYSATKGRRGGIRGMGIGVSVAFQSLSGSNLLLLDRQIQQLGSGSGDPLRAFVMCSV